MKTIALISQKGGSGKTTLAIHLATAFASAGYNTLLLDLDPQVSAAEWKDARQQAAPAVIAVPATRLSKVMDEAQEAATDILIIDTAPHSEGSALNAARAADLVLAPCQPSIMDLRAMRKTAELLAHSGKPAHAVLNAVSQHASVAEGAEEAIVQGFDIPVCPIRISDRVALNRCLIDGRTAQEYEPEGKAAREIEKLHKWVCQEKAVENSCRVVIDSQTGELYNLQFGARAPKSGTAITFSGRPPKGAPACKQGKLVTVSNWKEEKGIECPSPVVMAQAGGEAWVTLVEQTSPNRRSLLLKPTLPPIPVPGGPNGESSGTMLAIRT